MGAQMVRTNIEIDDELMRSALAATGLRTKKAVVEEALKLLVRMKGQERHPRTAGQADQLGRRHRRMAAAIG